MTCSDENCLSLFGLNFMLCWILRKRWSQNDFWDINKPVMVVWWLRSHSARKEWVLSFMCKLAWLTPWIRASQKNPLWQYTSTKSMENLNTLSYLVPLDEFYEKVKRQCKGKRDWYGGNINSFSVSIPDSIENAICQVGWMELPC